MVCSSCGTERPERGSCKTCGVRLCSRPNCRSPLPVERKASRCSNCAREANQAWRLENQGRWNELTRLWRSENPERSKEINRQSYSLHSEKRREEARTKHHKDSDRERSRSRKWHANNPERARERHRCWCKSNPDLVKFNRQKRRARKNGCSVSPTAVSKVIKESRGICALCLTFVPEVFRHVDHIVPLAKGGPHSQENLQLLCYLCNQKKHSKLPDEIATEPWVKEPQPAQPFLLNPDWMKS